MRPRIEIFGKVKVEDGGAVVSRGREWQLVLRDRQLCAELSSMDGQFTPQPLLPGRYQILCVCQDTVFVKLLWLGKVPIEAQRARR